MEKVKYSQCQAIIKDNGTRKQRQCRNLTELEFCHIHKNEIKRKYGRMISIIFTKRNKKEKKRRCTIS